MKLNGSNPERGELLFQDEWAAKRRFKDMDTIVVVTIGLLSGLYFIGWGFLAKITFVILAGVIVTLLTSFLLRPAVKLMPFRVYERGFTLPKAPSFIDGLYRRETFIRWERLERIEPPLKLIYDGDQKVIPEDSSVEDPFGVIKALHRQVPEKMTDAFQPYFAPIETREVLRVPFYYLRIPLVEKMMRPFSNIGSSLVGSIMPGITSLFVIMVIGIVLDRTIASGDFLSLRTFFNFIVLIGATIALGWMALSFDTDSQRGLAYTQANPTPEGVSLPVTILGRLVRRVRRLLPWSEIRTVRLRLCHLISVPIHEAEVVTVRGERFLVPYEILEAASRLSTFKSVDYDFENRAPSPSRGPAWRWNPVGLGVLGGIALGAFLLGFLAGYSG